MGSVITRKIQLTGGSTYIISLPKEWVRTLGLKPGDEVEINIQNDMSVLVSPKGASRAQMMEAYIGCDNITPEIAVREFIAYYMAGYGLVKFNCKKMKAQDREFVKESIRKRLLGAEVIEEDIENLEVQFLVGINELPLLKAIVRASNLSQLMFRDSMTALKEGDVEVAKEILVRDDEVDRFYFYIVRQLSMSVTSPDILEEENFSLNQITNLYVVAKSIERVSDHSVRIAELLPDTKDISFEKRNNVTLQGEKVLEVYRKALNSFRTKKKDVAHQLISEAENFQAEFRKLSESAIADKNDLKMSTALLLTIDSLRRVYRYSLDIAEAVVDMMAKSQG